MYWVVMLNLRSLASVFKYCRRVVSRKIEYKTELFAICSPFHNALDLHFGVLGEFRAIISLLIIFVCFDQK